MPGPGPTSRVAPTAKIPDDAPIAPPTRPGPSAAHPHVSYAPPAMPTPPPGTLSAPLPSPYQAPPSQPPAMHRPPPRAPMASNPSLSFDAPPTRPLGLIALVLIIDLGLAASGAFLLAKGLSTSSAKPGATPEPTRAAPAPAPAPPPPAAAPVQKSEAPAPMPEPIAKAPPPSPPAAVARPARKSPEPRRTTSATSPAKNTKPAAEPAPGAGPVTSPSALGATTAGPTVVSTKAEVDAKASASRAAFQGCREAAPGAQGTIEVAFRVLADGHVANVAVVENTTGNGELARCLERTISSWKVSPHDGAPLSFVRPFSYP